MNWKIPGPSRRTRLVLRKERKQKKQKQSAEKRKPAQTVVCLKPAFESASLNGMTSL